MHILFTSDSDDQYGASHSMYQTVSALLAVDSRLQISVVLTPGSSMERKYLDLGCQVYRIPYVPFYQAVPFQKWKLPVKYIVYGAQYYYGRLATIHRLEREMDVSAVDIIHSNSSREDFGAMLAQKYEKPLCWHIREFGDLDYPCYSYRRDHIALMNQAATVFIAVSDAVKTHWIEKGLCGRKMVRIYDGVADDKKPKENYRIADGQPVRLVMAGSICDAKGQSQLVEAIGILPGEIQKMLQVDMFGSGNKEYCRKIEKRIKTLGLDSVIRMKGYQSDVTKRLTEYDCGLMCSRSEGFGRVTVEYMMAGLPVIASDSGANPELVKEQENGLLYHMKDVHDLARKMKMIVESPELRERMGRNAARYARANFTTEKNANQIYELYKSLLSTA